MTINMQLAKEMGLSQETIEHINSIHDKLEDLLSKVSEGFNQNRYETIEAYEYTLQELWGFPQDPSYHTWKKRYEFKCQWANRTFRCKDTSVEFTIPEGIEEGAFFIIGKGFLDVGRLNAYSRRGGNLEEIKNI